VPSLQLGGWHTPLTHRPAHGVDGGSHTPAALHVSTALLVHRELPGVHTPVHAPPTQADDLALAQLRLLQEPDAALVASLDDDSAFETDESTIEDGDEGIEVSEGDDAGSDAEDPIAALIDASPYATNLDVGSTAVQRPASMVPGDQAILVTSEVGANAGPNALDVLAHERHFRRNEVHGKARSAHGRADSNDTVDGLEASGHGVASGLGPVERVPELRLCALHREAQPGESLFVVDDGGDDDVWLACFVFQGCPTYTSHCGLAEDTRGTVVAPQQ
jgi:hypothetical protein